MGLRTKIMAELEKRPASLRQLKKKLGNDKKVARALEELVQAGRAVCQGGTYAPAGAQEAEDYADCVACEFVKLGRSFGFAQPLDGSEDIFIAGRFLNGALPGDIVLVRISEHPVRAGSREGEIVKVQQPRRYFVGTVCRLEDRLALRPDGCPDVLLRIKRNDKSGVQPGEKAAVRVVERARRYENQRVRVVERFGPGDRAQNCARAILYSQGVPTDFPEPVLAEAARYEGAQVEESQIQGREDLRDWTIFTIDGPDTKDIDDAVSVRRRGEGYLLGVHIADVSRYVRPDTALDDEAFSRGTSVYYANSVVPMLPKALSNGICSLNPGQDRLAFSCLMELDGTGRLTCARLAKSVVRSRVKGVYSEVNALLDGTADEAVARKYAETVNVLPLLREVYEKRILQREMRGALEIETDEPRLILDKSGCCVGVEKYPRGMAERMIEEFMLLANESVAAMARRAKLPFVYRIHEDPPAERVESLKEVLDACGLACCFKGAVPTAAELTGLLRRAKGQPCERAVQMAVLRSTAKAKYAPSPVGHFGLGLADYAHFTSPIRRYPDLAVHRILSDWLSGTDSQILAQRYGAFAVKASEQSSARELAAMTCERDITDCYKAEFMSGHLGEVYEGVISSVTSFGIYVELENTVEGMIRLDALAPAGHGLTMVAGMALSDPLTGRMYRIGDPMAVRVAAADVAAGHVDFVPVP